MEGGVLAGVDDVVTCAREEVGEARDELMEPATSRKSQDILICDIYLHIER